MAVYTKITYDELEAFLGQYDLGALVSFDGILAGVENTNYHLFTDQGRFVLTILEKRVKEEDLPFFFAYKDFLNAQGILCPKALPDKRGGIITSLQGKPAVIVSFLEGEGVAPADITVDHCAALGTYLAKMHVVSGTFEQSKENAMGLPAWKALFNIILKSCNDSEMDNVEKGLFNLLEDELFYLEKNMPKDLPQAVVHADMFPDNVFFKEDALFGVIDFYFSCSDFLLYDLALVLNAWCFDMEHQLDRDKFVFFMQAYETVRPLEKLEKEHFSFMCRAASCRILMTRLHDFLFHPGDEFVKPKSPAEYIAKLKYHQSQEL